MPRTEPHCTACARSGPAARALLTPPSARAGLPVSRRGARRAHGHAAGAEQAAAAPSSARTPAMRGALVRLAQSSRAGPARSPLPRALPPHAAVHAPSTSAQRSPHPGTSAPRIRAHHAAVHALGTSAPGTSAPGTSASEPAARALLTPPSARAGLPVSRRGARRAHGHAAGAEQAAAAPSSARTPAMRGALVRLAQSSRAGPARSPLPRALPPHAAVHAPSTSAQRSPHPGTSAPRIRAHHAAVHALGTSAPGTSAPGTSASEPAARASASRVTTKCRPRHGAKLSTNVTKITKCLANLIVESATNG